MSQIDDLLNSACEVRDADQDRENTAMRVGGLLVSIIEYVGGFVTSTELERILNDAGEEFDRMYAKIDSRGMLDYRHSWFVPLSSMGSALDNVDGGVFDYAAEEGDLFYLKRGNYQIHEQQSKGSIGYPAKPRVVYYNLHTGRMYRWDGNDMVELGDLNRYRDRHVIDIMNLTDLNVMQIGEIAFKQSTGELVIKTGARQWFTFTADPNAIYCDKSGKRILIWNGTGWDEVGGGSGSEGGATSVAVKRNVNALQAKVDELIGLLANSAFSTSRPAPVGSLDWGDDTPVETYYNVSGISASHAMYSVTNAATRVLAGSSYNNVITAKAGYDLLGVTVNGVAQTVSNDSCTINIANVQGDIAIVVSAQAESVTPTITHSVTYNLSGVTKTSGATEVEDGQSLTVVLSKDSTSWDSVEGFNKRDIIVLMGGQALERGVDFTASQDAGTEHDITITVNKVTGDITIMNVTFKNQYLDSDDAFVGTSGRNRGTVTHIPIPDGCTSLRVFHGYVSAGSFRILTYNAEKTAKAAYDCYNADSNPNQYRDIDLTDSGNNKFIRSSFYYFPSSYTLATCYIKDVTHNKYIWKGDSVQ